MSTTQPSMHRQFFAAGAPAGKDDALIGSRDAR
jgi:hypothetical protein